MELVPLNGQRSFGPISWNFPAYSREIADYLLSNPEFLALQIYVVASREHRRKLEGMTKL